MYGSLENQMYNWSHYTVAFLLVFVFLPKLMFRDVGGSYGERIVANYIRMLFFVILFGFLLVITKLYEVIGILGTILLWIILKKSRGAGRLSAWAYLVAVAFDLVESPRTIMDVVRKFMNGLDRNVKIILKPRKFRLSTKAFASFLVLLVLAITTYIRLYTAVVNPAPKMSDGDTLLAWIKYIDLRVLMHDGVYPQGFFFFMATLGKFAVIDPLYVLNYTGPLSSTFIVVMMLYVVKKLTGSTIGAIVASTLYGVLGQHLLLGEWMRQSGSETEEFGFLLSFPTMYFFHRYLEDGRKEDFWTAFAGLSDSGLIHPLSYVLSLMACISVFIAHAVSRFTAIRRRMVFCTVAGCTTGVIALIPYILAYFFHIQSNQASQQFLQGKVAVTGTSGTSTSDVYQPVISLTVPTTFDVVAIVYILVMLIFGVFGAIRNKPKVVCLMSGLWGFMCYFTYEFGAYFTKSLVLSVRMTDLWAVVEAFVIGMGTVQVFEQLKKFRGMVGFQKFGTVGFVSAALVISPPTPILPYQVQWNEDVDAYLRIDTQFKYSGYMVVSPDFEYALVLGDGYHMQTGDFLKHYDPEKPSLTRYGMKDPDRNIATNVFVYYHKNIFKVSKTNSIYSLYLPIYQEEYHDQKLLRMWLNDFTRVNGKDYKVFYNGPNLEVYEFTVRRPVQVKRK